MAIPLVPVLIGAALGAAVTYVLTTRNARKQLASALQNLGDSVEAGAEKVKSVASDAAADAQKAAKKAASKVTD
jgi:hypothetical protein